MKEAIWRAARTFLQAAFGYAVVAIPTVINGEMELSAIKAALFGLAISAVSAGLAAVMNLPIGGGSIDNDR